MLAHKYICVNANLAENSSKFWYLKEIAKSYKSRYVTQSKITAHTGNKNSLFPDE